MLAWTGPLAGTLAPGREVEGHCPRGTMSPVVERISTSNPNPETGGRNRSPASTISTCCCWDDVPGCSEGRAQRRRAVGAQEQRLAVPGTGSVEGTTGEASDDC